MPDTTSIRTPVTAGRGTATGEPLAVNIPAGRGGSATFPLADTINYVCTIHPSLRGTLSIGEPSTPPLSAAPPPPPTSSPSPTPSPKPTARPSPQMASPSPDATPSPSAPADTPTPDASPNALPLTAGTPPPATATPAATPAKVKPIAADASGFNRPAMLYISGAVIVALILAIAGGYYGIATWR